MSQLNLNKKWKPLFEAKEDIRYILASGGRGSGKSFTTSLWLAIRFAQSKKNALYLREFMTNAAVSIIPQFLQQVSVLGLSFEIKRTEIVNKYRSKALFSRI